MSQFEKFTLLREYRKTPNTSTKIQSEKELENSLIEALQEIGYEYRPDIKNEKDLVKNLRIQIEKWFTVCLLKLRFELNKRMERTVFSCI